MIRLFSGKDNWIPPQFPVKYPNGMSVSDGRRVYYIAGDEKIPHFSKRTLDSWSTRVIIGTEHSLSEYKESTRRLGFRSGSIVLDFASLNLYYIDNNKRRKITDPDFFVNTGLSEKDAIKASEKEVLLHERGDDI